MASDPLVMGIDLGGTKIGTAVVDGAGNLLASDYRETGAAQGPDAVIRRILDGAEEVLAQAGVARSRVAAVGVGAPGPLDAEQGVVVEPPNLPGWDHVPLRQRVEDGLGLPAFLEKDANAAALGEHRFGAGQGAAHMLYITVSTGIGGGVILDGKLYRGANGAAGEIGHIVILPDGPLCGCGNRGCLEALASGTALAREARERVAGGAQTLILELARGDPQRITARVVADAAERGDDEARRILSRAMDYLGIGVANLVNVFNPQYVIVGGGLMNLGERLFGPVRRAVAAHAFSMTARAVQVVPAGLGERAGVLGAAAVALDRATPPPPGVSR